MPTIVECIQTEDRAGIGAIPALDALGFMGGRYKAFQRRPRLGRGRYARSKASLGWKHGVFVKIYCQLWRRIGLEPRVEQATPAHGCLGSTRHGRGRPAVWVVRRFGPDIDLE